MLFDKEDALDLITVPCSTTFSFSTTNVTSLMTSLPALHRCLHELCGAFAQGKKRTKKGEVGRKGQVGRGTKKSWQFTSMSHCGIQGAVLCLSAVGTATMHGSLYLH
jgi:hypothetical protein